MKESIYNANKTMRLLGHQYADIMSNPEVSKEYLEAHKTIKENSAEMDAVDCMSLFLLGVIWGKRIERAKRKGAGAHGSSKER